VPGTQATKAVSKEKKNVHRHTTQWNYKIVVVKNVIVKLVNTIAMPLSRSLYLIHHRMEIYFFLSLNNKQIAAPNTPEGNYIFFVIDK
jgi:hypothetical protein